MVVFSLMRSVLLLTTHSLLPIFSMTPLNCTVGIAVGDAVALVVAVGGSAVRVAGGGGTVAVSVGVGGTGVAVAGGSGDWVGGGVRIGRASGERNGVAVSLGAATTERLVRTGGDSLSTDGSLMAVAASVLFCSATASAALMAPETDWTSDTNVRRDCCCSSSAR